MNIKYITGKQMSEVDETATNKYRIKSEFLMENAGRGVAEFVSKLRQKPKRIVVFIGKGNNAGDGLVAARHLLIKNFDVELVSSTDKKEEFNKASKEQISIINKLSVKPLKNHKPKKGDLILDCVLGYTIKGSARGKAKELIELINSSKKDIPGLRVVSVDVPSGLNSDDSLNKQIKENKSIIKSDYILTLAMPKKSLKGLKNVYILNIGIPWKVYKELGIIKTKTKNYFNKNDIVKIS